MYVQMLSDPYFQVSSLESILSWLQDDTARVEDELLKDNSIEAMLKCFVGSKANSFENLLDPFLKMLRISIPLTIAISKSSAFFKRIIERLGGQGQGRAPGMGAKPSKPVVRVMLLKTLRWVCDVHPNKAMLVEKYGLLGVVEQLSKSGGDGAVLVKELAREIVPTLKPALGFRSSVSSSTATPDLSLRSSGGGGRTRGAFANSVDLSSMPSGSGSGLMHSKSKLTSNPISNSTSNSSSSSSLSSQLSERERPRGIGLAPKRLRRAASEASSTPLGKSTPTSGGSSSRNGRVGSGGLGGGNVGGSQRDTNTHGSITGTPALLSRLQSRDSGPTKPNRTPGSSRQSSSSSRQRLGDIFQNLGGGS